MRLHVENSLSWRGFRRGSVHHPVQNDTPGHALPHVVEIGDTRRLPKPRDNAQT